MDLQGFWNLPVIDDPENGERYYMNALENFNALERGRASLESRKPRLRKPSLKHRAGAWADARKIQVEGELDRRRWQKVVDRMKPLVTEAGSLMSSLVAEVDGPPPAKIQAKGFAATIAWRAEKQNQLLAAKIEYERLSQQWASHQRLLVAARKASGLDQRNKLRDAAQEKLASAQALTDAAQEELGQVVDFAAEAEEAFEALEA